MELKKIIRDVPDFPKKGIVFRDITTMLKDKAALAQAVMEMAGHFRDDSVDLVVGIESRGFIFGAAIAVELDAGFVPARKPGKLPAKAMREEYSLEYGTDSLEIHEDAIEEGKRVLIVDDLLATGGTASAACRLVEKLGGKITGLLFLVELDFLKGREKLGEKRIVSLINYDSE
jgi:adenine phosphoribosyltransferase